VVAVTLVRYDEIGLKGRNRRYFEGRLRENIARALGLPGGAVARERGRLFVRTPGGGALDEAGRRALSRIFGIRSFSPAVRVEKDLAAVLEAALEAAARGVERGGRTFSIDSRRSDKSFPFNSLELNTALGRAVQQRHPRLAVDLGRPDFTIHVEVRPGGAFVYDCVVPGPGGLPVGTGGRALLLLSGGIDSPVAGWMALKRGIALDAVHFHTFPYTSAPAQEKAVDLARVLATWRGQPTRVHLVSITPLQREIARVVPEKLWTVVLRRGMLRVAQAIARRDGHAALVTGDSLGQVASQTLENMAAAENAVQLPVLRPLLSFDKAEIVDQARRIGTFDLSVRPFDDCCVLFSPRRPETRARLEEVHAAEAGLALEQLVVAAAAGAEPVDIDPRPARAAAPAMSNGDDGAAPGEGFAAAEALTSAVAAETRAD
jgi:tRNA uracil 4-sulfurtransferase